MLAVTLDAVTMDTRGRAVPGGAATSPESAMAGELFDQFVSSGTFKSVLFTYRQLCEVLRLKPTNITNFYPRLKAKLHSWRAASLWAKLDKRASHKCYNRGKACPSTRVLLIGAGPCGLRAAIEAQLLGAKVVVLEKRDRFSRNNVLHLWPFVIHDLRNLGAKKFFGKFCAGSIDHISIRQLQIILLKVALLLGVEVHENVGFERLIEPQEDQTNERIGWHANVSPTEHPVSQYEFDVLIGADGKRNTLLGFNRKEFRGKLAIAVTANFINRHTIEEARVPEISGVAFIFNQKFFQDMRDETGIDLENIVYYKDDTHYFVMTAKKQSLLERGVIINDYNDTARLLAAENVDREALMEYARDAADFATNFELPHLDFAVNHYGQADVAMFDFTSMYAAENACRVVEKRGHKLLQGLVGDSLLEPFWPTGSGCARGFLSSFDVAWMIRSWASGKLTTLQVLAEREAIYRLLAQTTPENLSKDISQYTLNPSSRYPNLNLQAVLPSQVRSLFTSDGKMEEHILDVAAEHPKRKRHRESMIYPDMLLNWCQRQVALGEKIKIQDFTTSWKSGLALCAILHRYRPDLIDVISLDPDNIAKNNQLAFDICERELGIPPVMTGQEMADCSVPDKLSMISYISQVYESFRGEIPVVSLAVSGDDRAISPNKQLHSSTPLSILSRISYRLQNKRKYSIEKEIKDRERGENVKRKSSALTHKRRSKERDKGVALDLVNKDVTLTNYKSLSMNKPRESINTRVRNLEEKMMRDAGLRCHQSEESEATKAARIRSEQAEMNIRMLQEQLKKNGNEASVKKPRGPKVGKLRKDEWNVKVIEEKTKQQQNARQKAGHVEKPKIFKEIFENKRQYVDEKLKQGGGLTTSEQARYREFDKSFNKLNQRLSKGNLESGDRGSNQTALMTEHMTTIWDRKAHMKRDPRPPPPITGKSITQTDSAANLAGSESCYFCKNRVYSLQQLSAEGLFFHRGCFKCEYCSTSLRLGNYSFDTDAVCGGKFYCHAHFRMQKPDQRSQDMMKRKQAFLTCAFEEEKEKLYKTLLGNTEKALSPGTTKTEQQQSEKTDTTPVKKSFSPNQGTSPSNLLLEPLNSIGRDQTPERVEYENSIIELSEEELLTSELEEEELTQTNLGPSQDLATSEDEYSDLSTDSASDEEAYAEELERSLTADETRKLAETWQRKYSTEHSLLRSTTSSSADDEGSDTEICSGDTSDDVDSDAQYNIEHGEEDAVPLVHESTSEEMKTSDEKNEFTMEVPVIDLKNISKAAKEDTSTESESEEDLSGEEDSEGETGTEVDSDEESEPEAPLPPPQIPTIIIYESPPQNIDQEQEWDESHPPPESKDVKSADSEIHELEQSEGSSKQTKISNVIASALGKEIDAEDLKMALEALKLTSFDEPNTDGKFSTSSNDRDKCADSFSPDVQQGTADKKSKETIAFAPLCDSSSSELSVSSGISSLAKEIVLDVLKCAKRSITAEDQPGVVASGISSDSTSHTEESLLMSSSSNQLTCSKSSDSSSIPLIDLASPDQPISAERFPSNSEIPMVDLCSPQLTEEIVFENKSAFNTDKSVDSSNNYFNISEGKCDISSPPIFASEPPSLETSNISFGDGNESDLKVCTPEKDESQVKNHNEISFIPINTSNSEFKSPKEEFPIDSSFVTIRKNKSCKDTFSWDSDNSISLPHCYNEDANLSDNINDLDLSKDGIYHATVAQTIEGESTDQPVKSIPVKNSLKNIEYLLGMTSDPFSNNSPNILDKDLKLNKISSCSPVIKSQVSVDADSFAKNSETVPKASELHSNNVSFKSDPGNTESYIKDQKSDNFENDVFEKHRLNYIKDVSTSNLSNSVNSSPKMPLSANQETPEEKSPKSESKYSGYSGSFAEKMRPKSLHCDSIYLRSLNINLQKQPFTSLKKGSDKDNDYSTKDSMCNLKKKLFHDEDQYQDLPSSQETIDSKEMCAMDFNGISNFNRDFKLSSSLDSSTILDTPTMSKNINAMLEEGSDKLVDVLIKPKSSAVKHSSVSFSAPESYSDLVSPYTYAQARPTESSFPTKMRAKCDMDISRLRQKREKRKSVHEDIQGLPFADEEKLMSPVEPPGPPDVFSTPKTTLSGKSGSISDQDINWKTPDMIDEERYLRLQTTVEQEKARQEARARARLKSDEELGLSPNNYRKKYHRQLSLTSINYDELYSDEFCDQDDEELEDDIISGFCQSKSGSVADTFSMLRMKELGLKNKPLDTSETASQPANPECDVFVSVDSTDNVASGSSKPKVRASSEPCSVDKTDSGLRTVQQNKSDEALLSKHSTKMMSSSETSPDIVGLATPPTFDAKHKQSGGKGFQRAESSGGEEERSKPNSKKSFFPFLNFGKNASKEKPKQKPKEADNKELSSSLPNELEARSTITKSKPFSSHLKLPKSKEKPREKPKTKNVPQEIPEALAAPAEVIPLIQDQPSVSFANSQAHITPKYTVYRNPETMLPTFPVHLPVHKLENGLAPKASEDSFSDEDETHGGKASGHTHQLEKNDKNSDEKDKKTQRIVFKVQRQHVLKRWRNAQEIQRRLEELEVQQKELERNGVEIEKTLRGERYGSTNAKAEPELEQEWYTYMHSKNKLRREEQELLIRLKYLELEDRQIFLQQEIKKRMAQSYSQKDPSHFVEERNMLAEMLEIVEKRKELDAIIEQVRLKEVEEDKNLNSEVLAKGIKSLISPPPTTEKS